MRRLALVGPLTLAAGCLSVREPPRDLADAGAADADPGPAQVDAATVCRPWAQVGVSFDTLDAWQLPSDCGATVAAGGALELTASVVGRCVVKSLVSFAGAGTVGIEGLTLTDDATLDLTLRAGTGEVVQLSWSNLAPPSLTFPDATPVLVGEPVTALRIDLDAADPPSLTASYDTASAMDVIVGSTAGTAGCYAVEIGVTSGAAAIEALVAE